jgi:LmbE family N-acetylglucosaminyl deacetylase
MRRHDLVIQRRDFFTTMLASAALVQARISESLAQETQRDVFVERAVEGMPHKGKVLLAIQAHADDIPLTSAGTVAKLVKEGYTGYLVRATNDDMGDAPGLGLPGTIGQHVLRNEQDNAEVSRVLGLKKVFDLNYPNHRMADVSQNELQCRLIFLIRLLRVDTVVCWDPRAHDEENPDHWQTARGVEAACWMAGRAHDYPEQFAAGLAPHAVQEKYYYARRPQINRVVDVSSVIYQIIDANGPIGHRGPPEITAHVCVPNSPAAAKGFRCSAMMMYKPIETTSNNSFSTADAHLASNTASNTPKRSITSAALNRGAQRSTNMSMTMRCRSSSWPRTFCGEPISPVKFVVLKKNCGL